MMMVKITNIVWFDDGEGDMPLPTTYDLARADLVTYMKAQRVSEGDAAYELLEFMFGWPVDFLTIES